MSEINKPEVTEIENKLPEHKSLNPDQYKCNHVVAPENSCPWAIIQVYLGNQARRGDWDSPNECIRLIPESNANSEGNNLIYIEKCDKHGHWLPWQPTPEDIMGSDWSLLEPDNNMLVFDVTLGTSKYDTGQDWGYMSDKGILGKGESTFGALNITQNKTDIKSILMFCYNRGGLYLRVSFDKANYQKIKEVLKKNFYVSVDNVTYDFGTFLHDHDADNDNYEYDVYYYESENPTVEKLGAILKQTGETKRFYCNWR
ncbi:Thoeris anti-defense Tad2 family protein [Photorhabdus bodei]|uniref:DUF2829 domain-containing protein n=2 Tax=Photorhabdus bodei TaxID=2029681 RepID=A0AAW6BFF6_9GAMM|nr:MW1434 family type I TA system toxin [Photorhabdus bodei]MDB6371331.1 DUF2829 domain-containing protein [Photorhabdus bodei]